MKTSEKIDLTLKKAQKGLNICQTLVDACEDLKDIDAFNFSLKDIQNASDCVEYIIPSLNAIIKETQKEGSGLHKLVELVDGQIKDVEIGKTIDSIASTTNEFIQLSDGNVVPAINPTALLIASFLVVLKEETANISNTCNSILTFLKNDKESQIEGDLNVLNSITQEYKYNWNNKEYRTSHHKLVLDIKRSAEQNIIFFRKQIKSLVENDENALVAKTLKDKQNDLENAFKYYQLTLYIYGFSSFIETLLLGNFCKPYLKQTTDKLSRYSNDYSELFDSAFEYLQRTANSSLESKALKGFGNLLMKAKEGSWLNKKGGAINDAAIKQTIDSFIKLKEDTSAVFLKNIEQADSLFNKTHSICFDNQNIYFLK